MPYFQDGQRFKMNLLEGKLKNATVDYIQQNIAVTDYEKGNYPKLSTLDQNALNPNVEYFKFMYDKNMQYAMFPVAVFTHIDSARKNQPRKDILTNLELRIRNLQESLQYHNLDTILSHTENINNIHEIDPNAIQGCCEFDDFYLLTKCNREIIKCEECNQKLCNSFCFDKSSVNIEDNNNLIIYLNMFTDHYFSRHMPLEHTDVLMIIDKYFESLLPKIGEIICDSLQTDHCLFVMLLNDQIITCFYALFFSTYNLIVPIFFIQYPTLAERDNFIRHWKSNDLDWFLYDGNMLSYKLKDTNKSFYFKNLNKLFDPYYIRLVTKCHFPDVYTNLAVTKERTKVANVFEKTGYGFDCTWKKAMYTNYIFNGFHTTIDNTDICFKPEEL